MKQNDIEDLLVMNSDTEDIEEIATTAVKVLLARLQAVALQSEALDNAKH